MFGDYLFHLLRDGRHDAQYDQYLDKYPVKYTVRVSKKQVFDRGVRQLTSYAIHRFNAYAERMLRQELFNYLNMCTEVYEHTTAMYNLHNSPFTIKAAIYRFLDYYRISEAELSHETLKKAYYRYRKKQEKSPPDLSHENIRVPKHLIVHRVAS